MVDDRCANGVASSSFEIVETDLFVRSCRDLFSALEVEKLKESLGVQPFSGQVIPGSGGLRKIRWGRQGTGKQGGARVVYVVVSRSGRLYLLFAYAKSCQEDLTREQLRKLEALARKLRSQ